MSALELKIDGMSCGHCVMHVKKALGALDGVQIDDVQIGSAKLQFDPAKSAESAILDAIRDQGYTPTPVGA